MGFKKTVPIRLFTNGVMTGTSVLLSSAIDVTNLDNVGLEVSWTGSAVGTIEVLGSNSNATYYALTFNPVITQPAGTAGGYLIDLSQFPWQYFKLRYTNTSSTGVFNAWFFGKDLN